MSAKGKLRVVHGGHVAYCPGCAQYHLIDSRWQFNGNYDRPTFSPSLLISCRNDEDGWEERCHSFITNGKWYFLDDSTHALKRSVFPMREEEIKGAATD
jgi:hypothetical protein